MHATFCVHNVKLTFVLFVLVYELEANLVVRLMLVCTCTFAV